jgi:S-adenosylmethionine:diacylglycerol 3-amino-3-carboxypropyl transferase
MAMTADGATAWQTGRFDARAGASQLLFGSMHEDRAIESRAFPAGTRVFCIASAGCTALELSRERDVVAVDLNAVQVEYASRRLTGAPASRGGAERILDALRALAVTAGWNRLRVLEFLDLEDPKEQTAYWRGHLDTRRFRAAMDLIFSRAVLQALYAQPFLRGLPTRFGSVLRRRLERGFARHPNRGNPYARALLLGEFPGTPPADPSRIRFVHADAAAFLESAPSGSFEGFALSNILDGADEAYRSRLRVAVRRAAAPGAAAVLRSFAEPPAEMAAGNLAVEDRAMLWGTVHVGPAAAL